MGSEKAPRYISELRAKYPKMATHRGFEEDKLYQPNYDHADTTKATCRNCDANQLIDREPRDSEDPVIHYGLIASSNQVVKDSRIRDRLQKEHGALCCEMEAAGIMNNFPCLVIRGVCDYSDSHKSKIWQSYAATTAAAYAKELLYCVHPLHVEAEPKAIGLLSKS